MFQMFQNVRRQIICTIVLATMWVTHPYPNALPIQLQHHEIQSFCLVFSLKLSPETSLSNCSCRSRRHADFPAAPEAEKECQHLPSTRSAKFAKHI